MITFNRFPKPPYSFNTWSNQGPGQEICISPRWVSGFYDKGDLYGNYGYPFVKIFFLSKCIPWLPGGDIFFSITRLLGGIGTKWDALIISQSPDHFLCKRKRESEREEKRRAITIIIIITFIIIIEGILQLLARSSHKSGCVPIKACAFVHTSSMHN